MYHQNRDGPAPSAGQAHNNGDQRVVPGMEADFPQILALMKDRPCLRLVLSPTAAYGVKEHVEVEQGPLLGTSGRPNHVLAVVDKDNAEQVLGKDLAGAFMALKP